MWGSEIRPSRTGESTRRSSTSLQVIPDLGIPDKGRGIKGSASIPCTCLPWGALNLSNSLKTLELAFTECKALPALLFFCLLVLFFFKLCSLLTHQCPLTLIITWSLGRRSKGTQETESAAICISLTVHQTEWHACLLPDTEDFNTFPFKLKIVAVI